MSDLSTIEMSDLSTIEPIRAITSIGIATTPSLDHPTKRNY
jgi:hypothetical protein